MDGAALMSPVTVSRISMAFCSSSFLYSATMLDSARLSRIRILRRIRLLNFINLLWREVMGLQESVCVQNLQPCTVQEEKCLTVNKRSEKHWNGQRVHNKEHVSQCSGRAHWCGFNSFDNNGVNYIRLWQRKQFLLMDWRGKGHPKMKIQSPSPHPRADGKTRWSFVVHKTFLVIHTHFFCAQISIVALKSTSNFSIQTGIPGHQETWIM